MRLCLSHLLNAVCCLFVSFIVWSFGYRRRPPFLSPHSKLNRARATQYIVVGYNSKLWICTYAVTTSFAQGKRSRSSATVSVFSILCAFAHCTVCLRPWCVQWALRVPLLLSSTSCSCRCFSHLSNEMCRLSGRNIKYHHHHHQHQSPQQFGRNNFGWRAVA